MANKLLTIHVKGKTSTWGFDFYGDPKHIEEWRADGLEVYEILNTIPVWLPACLVKPWCVLQDIFNFKWL